MTGAQGEDAVCSNDQTESWRKQYAEIAELAGGLAHEIRNPLSTIRLNVELLREDLAHAEDPSSRRTLRRADRVHQETVRLESVLNDFLQFASANRVNAEACDLSELTREFAAFLTAEAESQGVEVRTHLPTGLPAVQCDAALMRQVFGNLCRNALAAMPVGGVLEIGTRRDGEFILLEVIDTGRGMTAAEQGKMFDAFYSHGTRGGSGLGLPTVRKIIEAHDGTIECDSEPGRGTRFRVRLPVVA